MSDTDGAWEPCRVVSVKAWMLADLIMAAQLSEARDTAADAIVAGRKALGPLFDVEREE